MRVPPLRERRADILELARYFLERHRVTRPLGLSTAAADALIAYDWPGNVRELERLIERSVALAATDVIQLDDLPPVVRGDYAVALMPSIDRRETLRAWGSRYVRLVLERCEGNKREACRVLDISYHTLQAYLRQPPPGGSGRRRRGMGIRRSRFGRDAGRGSRPARRLLRRQSHLFVAIAAVGGVGTTERRTPCSGSCRDPHGWTLGPRRIAARLERRRTRRVSPANRVGEAGQRAPRCEVARQPGCASPWRDTPTDRRRSPR